MCNVGRTEGVGLSPAGAVSHPGLVLERHPVFREHEVHSCFMRATQHMAKRGEEKIIHVTRESGTSGRGTVTVWQPSAKPGRGSRKHRKAALASHRQGPKHTGPASDAGLPAIPLMAGNSDTFVVALPCRPRSVRPLCPRSSAGCHAHLERGTSLLTFLLEFLPTQEPSFLRAEPRRDPSTY